MGLTRDGGGDSANTAAFKTPLAGSAGCFFDPQGRGREAERRGGRPGLGLLSGGPRGWGGGGGKRQQPPALPLPQKPPPKCRPEPLPAARRMREGRRGRVRTREPAQAAARAVAVGEGRAPKEPLRGRGRGRAGAAESARARACSGRECACARRPGRSPHSARAGAAPLPHPGGAVPPHPLSFSPSAASEGVEVQAPADLATPKSPAPGLVASPPSRRCRCALGRARPHERPSWLPHAPQRAPTAAPLNTPPGPRAARQHDPLSASARRRRRLRRTRRGARRET